MIPSSSSSMGMFSTSSSLSSSPPSSPSPLSHCVPSATKVRAESSDRGSKCDGAHDDCGDDAEKQVSVTSAADHAKRGDATGGDDEIL